MTTFTQQVTLPQRRQQPQVTTQQQPQPRQNRHQNRTSHHLATLHLDRQLDAATLHQFGTANQMPYFFLLQRHCFSNLNNVHPATNVPTNLPPILQRQQRGRDPG